MSGNGTDICCHYALKLFEINVVFPLTVFQFNLVFYLLFEGRIFLLSPSQRGGGAFSRSLEESSAWPVLGEERITNRLRRPRLKSRSLEVMAVLKSSYFLEISGDLGLLLWSSRKGMSFCELRCFCEGINTWILYFFRYFKRPYFKSGGGCDQITPAEKFLQEIGKS